MTAQPIRLPSMGEPVDELWTVLMDLGDDLAVRWTLIGGQMVLLHALEHGRSPSQVSQDGDIVADIRSDQGGLKAVVAALTRAGFDLESISTFGVAHRYKRATGGRFVVVDVLAPEGVGERADLSTTPPGHTIEVPGGPRPSTAASSSSWSTLGAAGECLVQLCWGRSSSRVLRADWVATSLDTTATSRCCAHSSTTRSSWQSRCRPRTVSACAPPPRSSTSQTTLPGSCCRRMHAPTPGRRCGSSSGTPSLDYRRRGDRIAPARRQAVVVLQRAA